MVFSSISDLWNKWNIQGFVLLSLSLQVFLILFSPIRKKTANNRIIFLLWVAYLSIDWVAAFSIELISHNQGNSFARAIEVDGALQAFWASFHLLHLGSPDTITTFSLEDSSLWRRHPLSLIFQVGAAFYVFAQIFPNNRSLVIPTMLIFLAGVIKNAERTLALDLLSLPRLREWVLSQHKSFVGADGKRANKFFAIRGWMRLLWLSQGDEAEIPESSLVMLAYDVFQIFKVFLRDLMFTRRQCEMSCRCFDTISVMDALGLISVELQFIYEVLYTKTLAIRSKWSYIFRFITFMVVTVAFVLLNLLKKHQLPKLDVEITYILLFGGIALDVIALVMLIFSDWIVANQNNFRSYSFMLVHATDKLRKPRSATCEIEPTTNITHEILDTPLIFRRWSESISACNLLSTSLKQSPRKMYKRDRSLGSIASSNLCNFPFRMAEKIISSFHRASETIARGCGLRIMKDKIAMITNTKHVSNNPFIKKLWIFIFKEVRRKSENMDEPTKVTKIFEARGDLFLKSRPKGIDYGDLLEDISEANFDNSIIMWHSATEIWYNKERPTKRNDEREFSKILFDYMLYLLLNQANVVSAVAGIAQITIAETLEELLLHISDATRHVEWLCMRSGYACNCLRIL